MLPSQNLVNDTSIGQIPN